MDSVASVDGVPIRLTEERWFHIVENHDDMAGHYDDVLETVADPDLVLSGHGGSLIAVVTLDGDDTCLLSTGNCVVTRGLSSQLISEARSIGRRPYGKKHSFSDDTVGYTSRPVVAEVSGRTLLGGL